MPETKLQPKRAGAVGSTRLVRPERVQKGDMVLLTATVIESDEHYPLVMIHDHVSGHNVCYMRPHIGGLLVRPNDRCERWGPAAPDARIGADLNGWPPSAPHLG